jgi:predicted cupin superfamily sugar epimerase
MDMTKEMIINNLNLEKHIEGGWFKEVYENDLEYDNKSILTSIYFLLDENNFSAYHQLTSDELWYYHDGATLHISMIDPHGHIHDVALGKNIEQGERLFYAVPKGWIFGSYVNEGFALVSCAVSPGFTYEDFKLFDQNELLKKYPEHKEWIKKLTRK